MTDSVVSSDTTGHAADRVLLAARGLHGLVDAHGEENDRTCHIAEPVVEQLFATGAIGALTPRALGGAEMTPRQAMDLFRTLSYADPSTGWVTFAMAFAAGMAGAFLDRDVAAELFATPRFGLAGQGTRAGSAVPTDDGYLLTGDWSFASGIKHATHLITAAKDTVTSEVRLFVLPVGQVSFTDNWDVLGLRGTGSIDYMLSGAFVPAGCSAPALSTEPVTGGDLYRIGIGNFASINHGGWALGVGRRLLDEMATGLRRKGGQALDDATAEDFAAAEIALRAARALLYDTWAEIEDVVAEGDPIPLRLETLARAALHNATWRTHEIAQLVYTNGGSAALRYGTIQRLYRDVHGGTQHISSSRPVLRSAGRELAGLAEGRRWIHHALA